MPRIIEIVLFLTPFVSFAVWRLLFPSPSPPLLLVYAMTGFVVLMLASLFWLRHIEAGDAHQVYVPARLINGRVIPAERAPPP